MALIKYTIADMQHRYDDPDTNPVSVVSTRARTTSIPIADIVIGQRYRRDLGDLAALASSIMVEGLMQPIAVTERNELVAGERRLRACRDILKWPQIPVHVVSVSSIAAGEFAENVIRKDFTVSERVALAEHIKTEIGNRQGQRTELLLEKTEVSPGATTRAVAAARSGFDSESTYQAAKTVVAKGVPELVAAVDAGHVPITVAAELTSLAPEAQIAAVAGGRLSVQTAAKEIRKIRAAEREDKPRFRVKEIIDGTYPCTFANCTRSNDNPFTNPAALGNHRYAAHGIRSTNHESIARQSRRDQERQEKADRDARILTALSPAKKIQDRDLDRGEAEMLRRTTRLCWGQWAVQNGFSERAVVKAMVESSQFGFEPPKNSQRRVDAEDAYAAR